MARRRSNITGLSNALGTSGQPIYALDGRRKIIYANAACADWLGVPLGELLEVHCDYHSEAADASGAALGNSLCPPPSAFHGDRVRATLSCPRAAGGLTQRDAEFLPLAASNGTFGVLVLVDDHERIHSQRGRWGDSSPAELHRSLHELRHLLGQSYAVSHILGNDPAIVRVREQVRLATESNSRVVVIGPPGSGREHIARTIHYGWGRTVDVPQRL